MTMRENRGTRYPNRASVIHELPPINRREVVQRLFGERMIPSGNANPGLVYERYLKVWQNATQLAEKDRATIIRAFIRDFAECRPKIEPLLLETNERLDQLATERAVFTTQERLVCGLGASHPLENGFTFDYGLGVPYLPGSSVKGCARHYARRDLDEATIEVLFGPDEIDETTSNSGKRGDVVFFSAYPEAWPLLDVDVINCHQPAYYSSDPIELVQDAEDESRFRPANHAHQNKAIGPAENESPIPVFFLTVKPGTTFVFRCAGRSEENARVALDLLGNALREFGIGAKTAIGYGVMG